MGLTSGQYDEIMRMYDREAVRNKHILDDRTQEVYSKLPEYGALDDKIRATALDYGKRAILGDKNALFEMDKIIDDLESKKESVLLNGGFSKDYLKPVYTCRDCMDTGYIGGRKCHCLEQKILKMLYSQSNIENILDRENFDTLSFDYYNDGDIGKMQKIVNQCREFVSAFDKKYENLVFYGKPGVGKTFLTNCIAKALLDTNHSVIYFTSLQMFDKLSEYAFSNDFKNDISEMREDIFTCDLLIIDDLGTEVSNNFTHSQLFLIINERDLREKSTIISTNLTLSELSERYDDRISSRIIGKYSFIKPDIDDIRFKIKKL